MFLLYEDRYAFIAIPRQGLALPGVSVELLAASAAGRAASGGFLLWFAGRTAGGAASGRLFLRLARRATGGASPAGQIRERHECVPPVYIVEPISRFALLS